MDLETEPRTCTHRQSQSGTLNHRRIRDLVAAALTDARVQTDRASSKTASERMAPASEIDGRLSPREGSIVGCVVPDKWAGMRTRRLGSEEPRTDAQSST